MFPGAKRVIKFVVGIGAFFVAAIFVGPRTEASFGGFLSAQVTGPNQITVYYNDTVTNNDPAAYSNLGRGLAGHSITGAISTDPSDHIVLELDGFPLAPNAQGTIDIDSSVTYAGGGHFPGATVQVTDAMQPTTETVTLDDKDSSGDLTAGDDIVVWFNEPMDKTTITTANADARLWLSNGHTFGTTGAGMNVTWNTNGTIVRITVGSDNTIEPGDTVSADSYVTDVAGNLNNTPAPRTIPTTATTPRTLYFNGAVDQDWSELGNWWNDEAGTDPAASLPTAYDNVVILAKVFYSTGIWEVRVNSATVRGGTAALEDLIILGIQLHALHGVSMESYSGLLGNVVGDVDFSGFSFAGNPFMGGEFLFSSSAIIGDASFTGTTANYGTIYGNGVFYGEYGNAGLIYGNAEFNNMTSNPGIITGNAIFRDNAFNGGFGIGIVEGNADVYYPSENPISGSVYGTVTYHGYDWTGSGTVEDPYVITRCSQLQDMNTDLSAHYKLGNDINCSDSASWNANADEWVDGVVGGTLIPDPYGANTHTDIVVDNNGYFGFEPIGNGDTPFTGSLDGDGHTISNLWIFRKNSGYNGLFGKIVGGSVSNLTLNGISVVGGQYTGGLVGFMDDTTVSHVTSTAGMVRAYLNTYGGGLVGHMGNDSTLDTVTVSGGEVHGSGNIIGGVIGNMEGGTVTNSSSSASADGGLNIGGFVGEMIGGTISDSYATGAVASDRSEYYIMKTGYDAGGFAGYVSDGVITRSYATGNVTASGSYVGGFIGYAYNPTISYSFATGDVTGENFTSEYGTVNSSYAGGFIGAVFFANIHDAYAMGDVHVEDTGGAFIGTMGGSGIGIGIENVYATGAVTGTTNLGGLIAATDDATPVTDSFWNTETTGQETSHGGTGKTSAEMRTTSLYTDAGWDFDTVWARSNGVNDGFPSLQYQELDPSDTTAPVLTTVHALSGSVSTDQAVFTFTTSEVCDYRVSALSSSTHTGEVQIDPAATDTTLRAYVTNTQAGGTYSFSFSCVDASLNESNTLTVGPFTIPANRPATISGGYGFGLPKGGSLPIPGGQTIGTNNHTASSATSVLNTPSKKKVRTLKLGMTGDDVLALQKKLNALGFIIAKTGVGSPGKESRTFGKKTKVAVMAFQKANKLKADGAVGPATRKAMGLE